MEHIILDTDFETDCDDVAALATLFALENRGDLKILGVIASVNDILVAQAIAAFNISLGRQDIAIGSNFDIKNSCEYLEHKAKCHEAIYLQKFIDSVDNDAINNYHIEDGVELYRKLLEKSEDNSVTICAIGLLTVLAKVLELYPQLVHQKVKKVVTMGNGIWKQGNSGFNWNMDRESTNYFLTNFHNEIYISPAGVEVLTGSIFSNLHKNNLLKTAYETFGKREFFLRPSWDQITVLIAANGFEKNKFTFIEGKGKIIYNPNSGEHYWQENQDNANHYCINIFKDKIAELSTSIDNLCLSLF